MHRLYLLTRFLRMSVALGDRQICFFFRISLQMIGAVDNTIYLNMLKVY